jgi:hypothetical protein
MLAIIRQIGALQIDTLQRVARSHYIALWSRAGNYDPAALDALSNEAPRRLFEYWYHAACFIPIEDYPYLQARMQIHRQTWEDDFRWAERAGMSVTDYQVLLAQVLGRIREEGGLRTSDFEDPRTERGSWWDWKPAKQALEALYNMGDLMIARRAKFQRVYDLPERVLPPQFEAPLISENDYRRHLLERAALALGAASPKQITMYTYQQQTAARPVLAAMIAEGVLHKVEVELFNGQSVEWLIHRERRAELEAAAEGALPATLTTFLSPFDSLFWGPEWETQLWGFEHRVEAYTPAPKRRWGYLCFPILHRERLIGRLDPRLDRKAGVLHLENLHLEPGVMWDEELVAEVAEALRRFMAFHGAGALHILHSDPAPFGEAIRAAF